MELNVRTWGSAERTALLVHGFTDDAETWWRVGPAVADLGYTVLAPDLRGHGRSPRAETYQLEDFAQDLVDTFPAQLDVAIGHSLGALALGLAAGRLQPSRTVLIDPPWLRSRDELVLGDTIPTSQDQLPPNWSSEDVAVDLASNSRLDPRVTPYLNQFFSLTPPPLDEPGTIVLVPELDPALPVTAHATLEALGYRVLSQPGVRHVMHRDGFAGFMELLAPELRVGEIAA